MGYGQVMWAAGILTVLAIGYLAMLRVGNNRWQVKDRERGRYRWVVGFVLMIVAMAWLAAWGLSSAAHATAAAPRESILPPGMRSMTIDLKRDPDVRCVVPNCFTPPPAPIEQRRRSRNQRKFERWLLSPAGRGRLE